MALPGGQLSLLFALRPAYSRLLHRALATAGTSSGATRHRVSFPTGLPALKSISLENFNDYYDGSVVFGGTYPSLRACFKQEKVSLKVCPASALTTEMYAKGLVAYINATYIPDYEFQNYPGDVAITGLRFLKSVGTAAFKALQGRLIFTGKYPALEYIKDDAFTCRCVH